MYLLEKLRTGRITPGEQVIRADGMYQRQLKKLCEIENQLSELLPADGTKLLQAYAEAQQELHEIENRETFIEAFRMGAQIILDVVSDYEGEFRYSGEDMP